MSKENTESDNPFTDPAVTWTNKNLHVNRQLSASLLCNLFLIMACLILSTIAVYQALFLRPDPYVLKVDEMNRVEFGGFIEKTGVQTAELIPSQLMRFVENWRTVTPDNTLQKKFVKNLYCMIPRDGKSRNIISDYYREDKNDPFKVNREFSIATKISTLLKLSAQTWSVEWIETIRTFDGMIKGQPIRYKGNFLIKQGKAGDDCLEGNPLGMYVSELNWTVMK